MDRKKYFSDLYTLFEASAGMAGGPEVMPQENIADTGMDMGGTPQMMADPNAMAMAQDPTMGNVPIDPSLQGMEDPSLMGGFPGDPMMNMQEPVSQDSALIMEKEKFKKLFELFEDLKTYADVFTDNMKFVDINLIDNNTLRKLERYTSDVKDLSKKIENYLINIFNSESYEKVLYTYILFRTEMLTSIKGLRRILDLDHMDKKLEG